MRILALAASTLLLAPNVAHAQQSAEELANQLANPVSSLISVPFQNNYDCCFGPEDGFRYTLNIQPVIPVSISQDWNLIIRTILPIVYQEAPVAGLDDAFGVSDVTQSFFFSPKASHDGLTWAIGPVFLWPIGESGIGSEKWGAGPTGLVLKQQGRYTYGALVNHIWSYSGDDGRDAVISTFLQPFINYTFPDSTNLVLNTESAYDWKNEQWTVPINFGIGHIYNVSGQRIQLSGQGRIYAESPDEGPDWGARLVVTLLFPER